MNNTTQALLTMALQTAVPLWIARLQHEPWNHVVDRAQKCAQVIAEKGDVILYRSKKAGQTASAFNHLAEGIACIAFASGGVTIFGQHWEARHDGGPLPEQLNAAWFTEIYEKMLFIERG